MGGSSSAASSSSAAPVKLDAKIAACLWQAQQANTSFVECQGKTFIFRSGDGDRESGLWTQALKVKGAPAGAFAEVYPVVNYYSVTASDDGTEVKAPMGPEVVKVFNSEAVAGRDKDAVCAQVRLEASRMSEQLGSRCPFFWSRDSVRSGYFMPDRGMDLLDWCDQKKRAAKKEVPKSRDFRTCLEIILGMICALQRAHGNNTLHNDVKLDNFLIQEKTGLMEVTLADFGASMKIKSQAADRGFVGFGYGAPNFRGREIDELESKVYDPLMPRQTLQQEFHRQFIQTCSIQSNTYALAIAIATLLGSGFMTPALKWDALRSDPRKFMSLLVVPKEAREEMKDFLCRMMSQAPHERPSLQEVFKYFAGLAANYIHKDFFIKLHEEVSEKFLKKEGLTFSGLFLPKLLAELIIFDGQKNMSNLLILASEENIDTATGSLLTSEMALCAWLKRFYNLIFLEGRCDLEAKKTRQLRDFSLWLRSTSFDSIATSAASAASSSSSAPAFRR